MNYFFYCKRTYILFFILFIIMYASGSMVFAAAKKELISSPDYSERPTLESSLFQSDQSILDEEAIVRILTSKFVLPDRIRED